jgi:RHS repeat-associated protein
MAFGEVLYEEHSSSFVSSYLYNAKELDRETDLYYYGARYYDPKVSVFLNVELLAEQTMEPYL